MSTALSTVENDIFACEQRFNAVNAYKLNFKREASFALQLLKANNFLLDTAIKNPDSLESAISNLAAIGISLNPATKEAYLVPRKNQVCLDISAIGLIKLATDSGSIRWAQARIVHEKDEYENKGINKEPIHGYKTFGDRGKVVGVYVVARTSDGDFLTEEMSLEDCYKIRDRSEAWKAYKAGKTSSCPWATDEGEMMKKTVIKRASKLWPKSERLDTAVQVLNEHEGIDFNSERKPHMDAGSITPPSELDFFELRELLKKYGKTEEGLLGFINAQSGLTDDNKLTRIEDFNSAQLESAKRILGGGK